MQTSNSLVKKYVSSFTFSPCIFFLSMYLSVYLYIFLSIYLYIYLFICYVFYLNILFLSVCLFVSNKRQNGWTDRVPNFVWALTRPQRRVLNDEIFKILCRKFFIFVKIWKCAEKYYEISKHFFYFYTVQRDKATVKSWNRRWPRSALKAYYKHIFLSIHLYYISIYLSIFYLSIYLFFSIYLLARPQNQQVSSLPLRMWNQSVFNVTAETGFIMINLPTSAYYCSSYRFITIQTIFNLYTKQSFVSRYRINFVHN